VIEVLGLDLHRVEQLRVYGVGVQVDVRHDFSNRGEGCLHHHRREIGADVAVRVHGHSFEVHVLGDLHVSRFDAKDFEAALVVGLGHEELAIEATEAAEGGVDDVGAVGGGDYYYVCGRLCACMCVYVC